LLSAATARTRRRHRRQLGIAKGSVFQHFKSKDGLFFEAYKKAVQSFPKYMQPAGGAGPGFFAVLRYWLVRTENMVRDNCRPIESISWATTDRSALRRKSIVSS